jgi:LPXTG-site transpeptidase (sortase) family protein
MLKRILILFIIILLFIFTESIIRIDTNKVSIDKPILINTYKETPIGKLIINKINLNKDIYSKNSKENTIEKNIQLLKESTSDLIIIAAHSGSGERAFFNNLNKLKKNDEITLIINNKTSKYIVKEYWEQKKNGYIDISKEEQDQLILTTCSPNHQGYQLIVNSIKKESN